MSLEEARFRLPSPLRRIDDELYRCGPLDERETSIILMLSWGLDDRMVARELNIGPRTVQRDLANLMSRIGARTRFSAGVAVALNGWVSSSRPPQRIALP
jgi:DNA-binding NarL/FixJ family response regulator